MSDTQAAIRAAREVQADTLAPELFRQANEWFLKARSEYKFKNFAITKDYAAKSRRFAEQAEFEAIRIGGSRNDIPPDPSGAAGATIGLPPPPPAPPTPPEAAAAPLPTPTGTPIEDYARRKAEDDARAKPSPVPEPSSTVPYNVSSPPGLPSQRNAPPR